MKQCSDVPADVLSHLPERGAMRQSIRHTRRRNMPADLRTLEELEDIQDHTKEHCKESDS